MSILAKFLYTMGIIELFDFSKDRVPDLKVYDQIQLAWIDYIDYTSNLGSDGAG